MVRLYFVSYFLLLSIFLHAQDVVTLETAPKSIGKLYNKAEKCAAKNKIDEAISILEKAVKKEPYFIDGFIRLGGLSYDRENFKHAASYFQNALSLDSTNLKLIQALALSYEKMGDYENALYYLEKLLENPAELPEELKTKVVLKISHFTVRKELMAHPVAFQPVPLGSQVNDPNRSEYSPSLTADGKRLFFTRVVNNQEDIYYSNKDSSGKWNQAIMLPNLNTFENEGAHNIAADGKTILFTLCSDGKTGKPRGCNIYVAFKRNGRWTSPVYFDAINSQAWDTQPNISSDGNIIIFASKRPGGYGQSDLWWSKRNEQGKWEVPQNMGEPINTSGREESPFFHPDGKTLFFKSDGHPGMGSFDLFRSAFISDSLWTAPENIGYPINTLDHEGAMVVALDGKTAFYSRGNGKVNFDQTQSDLFTFELPLDMRADPVGFVMVNVYDHDTQQPLKAKLAIQDSDYFQRTYSTDEEGGKLVVLPLQSNYSLNINREKYYFHSERFELADVNTTETAFEINVYLKPIKEEISESLEPIILKNVLFETGSYTLLPESYFELNRLITLLKENSDLNIEVRGHTDNIGEEEDNQKLSESRAKSVHDYLIKNGISEDRLTFVGLGESQPIATNASEQGRKINRRTEFIIKQ